MTVPYSENDAFVSGRLLISHGVSRRRCQRSCHESPGWPFKRGSV